MDSTRSKAAAASPPVLTAAIQELLSRYAGAGNPAIVVGFSGGLDSTVLLHCLASDTVLRPRLKALHVHHGLQADADAWAAHCRALCNELRVDFELQQVKVPDIAERGLEAAARHARYAAFESSMQPGDVLMLAHHQRDQAETLLLQSLRGAGVPGLAGMPAARRFAQGWLLRPWLQVPWATLQAYAQQHGLRWVEDPSNQGLQADRNYLRHNVMPELQSRWPTAIAQLARSAGHLAEAARLLDELAEQDLAACAGEHAGRLPINNLRTMSAQRRRNLLRYWLASHRQRRPSTAVLAQIETEMLSAREDAEPRVELENCELRRYRDWLYLLPPLPAPPPLGLQLEWQADADLMLPAGCGVLRTIQPDTTQWGMPEGHYQVRFMQGGERIRPLGSRHHRRLKTLCQEACVPPWVRRRMPLIYHGQQLVAVADRWISADLEPVHAQSRRAWRWEDSPPGWNGREAQP